MTQPNETQAREQLWTLIKDIRFAMFTTHDDGGHLHARPMTTQNRQIDEDHSLWFFMSRSGEPVAELSSDANVNVAYADPDRDAYVSVSGVARVVDDRNRAKQLWGPMNEAWFPGGVDDPDLALVRVDIVHADYWDVKANKLTQLYRMAKAAVTGKPPEDMGEHGQVRMG